jgi:transcriptional regulator of arginine metabolism
MNSTHKSVPHNPVTPTQRRATLRRLLQASKVGTQAELRDRLKGEGISVDQATLSRDLSVIGVRRVRGPNGSVYEVAESLSVETSVLMANALIQRIEHNGALVVILTTPGAASTVALAIDAAKLDEVLGTIAGDDTIFVAPRKARGAAVLERALKQHFWGNGTRGTSGDRA